MHCVCGGRPAGLPYPTATYWRSELNSTSPPKKKPGKPVLWHFMGGVSRLPNAPNRTIHLALFVVGFQTGWSGPKLPKSKVLARALSGSLSGYSSCPISNTQQQRVKLFDGRRLRQNCVHLRCGARLVLDRGSPSCEHYDGSVW